MTTGEKETAHQDVSNDAPQYAKAFAFDGFFGLLLLILLGLIGFNCTFFVVNHVIVQGNRSITPQEVILDARLEANQTLLQIGFNMERIHRNLLQDTRIARATVSLGFPNRITIRIKERRPLFLLSYARNLLIVSEDGVVLGSASGAEKKMPIVNGVTLSDIALGTKIDGAHLKIVRAIIRGTDENMRQALSQIDLANYQLYLDYPNCERTILVEFGDSLNLDAKLANLRAILAQTNLNVLDKIDLREAELPSIIKYNGQKVTPDLPVRRPENDQNSR